MSDLAETLTTLRKRAELSRRQLEDVSGVSEETIKAIEYRRNLRPTPDTLQKPARGLATNRALSRLDHTAAAEVLADLMQAAGYLPQTPVSEPAPSAAADLTATLHAMGYRPDEAPLVDTLVTKLLEYSPRQRRQILDFMDRAVDLVDPDDAQN